MTETPYLRPVEATESVAVQAATDGITRPRRRGGGRAFSPTSSSSWGSSTARRSSRPSRPRARPRQRPRRCSSRGGALTQAALSRAIAERYGFDHLDLTAFNVDMTAANLINSGAAKRYEAVQVG